MTFSDLLVKTGLVRVALAQLVTTEPTDPLGGKFSQLGQIFIAIVNIVFYVGIALTIIFLIMGGIRYITSGGSKEGAEAARSNITNAIIGFIVVLGAIALRLIIANVLGGAESLQLPGWFTSTT